MNSCLAGLIPHTRHMLMTWTAIFLVGGAMMAAVPQTEAVLLVRYNPVGTNRTVAPLAPDTVHPQINASDLTAIGALAQVKVNVLPFGHISTSADPLLDQYVQFSVSAKDELPIKFETITYTKRSRFNLGPQTASIRSSLDHFASDVDTITVNPQGVETLMFDLSRLPSVTAAIEFRIYFYDAPEPGGDWADLASTERVAGATGLQVFGAFTSAPDNPFAAIPLLRTYTVTPDTTQVLPGRMSTDPTDDATDPNGGIVPEDTIGNFAIAALYNAQSAWYFRDGRYNDNDWQVDRGTLQGVEPPQKAFTLHEAQQKHTECCLGSAHGIFFKFPTQEDYHVYELKGGITSLITTVTAQDIVVGGYTRVGDLTANDTVGTRTLIFAKATSPLSAFHQLGDGVEGATVAATPFGSYVQMRYTVSGKPFDTKTDYTAGPDDFENRYGLNRQFFHVVDGTRVGVVWQSHDDGTVFVSWIGPDPTQIKTLPLPTPAGTVLAAATSDTAGTIYTFMVQAGNGRPDDTRSGTLLKIAANGIELARVTPDTGRDGLNIVEFGTLERARWVASLHYVEGMLALFIGRIQHQSSDGLNHQAATTAIYAANTLEQLRGPRQTSSHSWENVLTHTQDGKFLGIDLGDNFPRGIHLHRFDHQERQSRVIYTFKTEHLTDESNEPFYRSCPNGKTYIQRSNDNNTYTELGGVTETMQGIVAVFSSERSGLDNCAVGNLLNAPRNLALVLVRSDIENATRDADNPSVVTNDLVLSQSDYTVEGEYYDFLGQLKKQRNVGVIWLTDYPADLSQNASRVKSHPLGSDEVLILWELWAPKAYQSTHAMSVKPDGTIVQPPVALSELLRLNRRDDLFDHAGNIYAVAGESTSRQLILHILVRSE